MAETRKEGRSTGRVEKTERELEQTGRRSAEDETILEKEGTGRMTVSEAGHLGGEIGGEKGGQKVQRLIEEGKEHESEHGARTGESESRAARGEGK